MPKLSSSGMIQRRRDLGTRIVGRAGLASEDLVSSPGEMAVGDHVEERLRSLSFTIAAGTSQIQRNIVAERILGLPKEPK